MTKSLTLQIYCKLYCKRDTLLFGNTQSQDVIESHNYNIFGQEDGTESLLRNSNQTIVELLKQF